MGGSNYELLESLLQGRELEEVTLNDLRIAIEKHFQPSNLILAERVALMFKVQKLGLHEFYAELQKAANGCSFDSIQNHQDAFVTMIFIGCLASVETRALFLPFSMVRPLLSIVTVSSFLLHDSGLCP